MATGPTFAITFMMAAWRGGERKMGTDGVISGAGAGWQQHSGTSGDEGEVVAQLLQTRPHIGQAGSTRQTRSCGSQQAGNTAGQRTPHTHGSGTAHSPE
jgi:hypothetical protein